MAKSYNILSILFLYTFFICGSAHSSQLVKKIENLKSQQPNTAGGSQLSSQFKPSPNFLVRSIYLSQIGVRESTQNSGLHVEAYLKYVGLQRGNPWCAAFVCWVFGQSNVHNPRTGWTPALFPSNKIIWQRRSQPQVDGLERSAAEPNSGDVFGIYFAEKGRIAHAGFIDSWSDRWAICVEGNTNVAGSREGDGVYRKRRLISSINKVARYIADIPPSKTRPKSLRDFSMTKYKLN